MLLERAASRFLGCWRGQQTGECVTNAVIFKAPLLLCSVAGALPPLPRSGEGVRAAGCSHVAVVASQVSRPAVFTASFSRQFKLFKLPLQKHLFFFLHAINLCLKTKKGFKARSNAALPHEKTRCASHPTDGLQHCVFYHIFVFSFGG